MYMSSILLGMHLYRMHNGMDDRAAVSIEFYIPRATANNSKATMKFKINLKSRKNSKELKCISACLLVVFFILKSNRNRKTDRRSILLFITTKKLLSLLQFGIVEFYVFCLYIFFFTTQIYRLGCTD